jgi:hypothetical protein
MAYRRKTGDRHVISIAKASGVTIASGDLVKKNTTNNNVTNASISGSKLLGIALEAGASASTAAIKVDLLYPGEWIVGDVDSGTPASGDFKSCDANDADGVAVDTDTNHDFLYMYNGTTTSVDLLPKLLEVTSAN